jgi:hypothetical protein
MSDIVTRLRNWRTVHLARLHLLMDEAADEMERLRADWPEQLAAARSEVERLCHVLSQKNHCPDADNAAKQDTLTDEEREAIAFFARDNWSMSPVLRGLLERLK